MFWIAPLAGAAVAGLVYGQVLAADEEEPAGKIKSQKVLSAQPPLEIPH
jgi:hypothetical protein